MELIIIDEREKYNASASANAFADKNTRNRVYVNTLGSEIVLKYLASENINISNIHNIHSIRKVLEEIDISDIMLPNIHIDVRVVYNENEIFIPKSHFEYNITPDIYVVIKPAKNYSGAEILGFFEPSLINKKNENRNYYFIEKEKLTSASEFIEFIKNFDGNTRHNLSESESENCESMMISFADNDISTTDKKYILEQLVKSDDLRNKFIEFENFETLSYKAMSDSSIIKNDYEEIQEDEITNIEDDMEDICEENTDFDSNILEESSSDDEDIENELEEINEFEDELEEFEEPVETEEFDEELEELEIPFEIDDKSEDLEEPAKVEESVDWNLIDRLENIGEVMAAGAAAVATTQNFAKDIVSNIAENLVSDTIETVGEIFDNNKEESSDNSSFDELPEIKNLIDHFDDEPELPEEEILTEDNIEELENIDAIENESNDEIIETEVVEETQEPETILEELPSEIEEDKAEEELPATGFGNTLLENLHSEEENISIENLEFEEAELEVTPLEPFCEVEKLDFIENVQEINELAEEDENITLEELPIIEDSTEADVTTEEETVEEENSENNSLDELPEIENIIDNFDEEVEETEDITETGLSEIDNLPEIDEAISENIEEVQEELSTIEHQEELPLEEEEEIQPKEEFNSIEETEEDLEDTIEELPEIENFTIFEELNANPEEEVKTDKEISEELPNIEDITMEQIETEEESAPEEDLFASIDNILPDPIESISENAENIEDIPDISALASEIIPDDNISENIAPEKTQTENNEDNSFDISTMADNSELEVLYSENETKVKPEIPEEQTIPGAAFIKQKQPLNKKYLVTAALTVIMAITAFGFIKNKNNEISDIPEIPQNIPAENSVDENILENNTPIITDEVQEVQEVKQVEEIKKPTEEVKQDIKNNISTNKTPQTYVSVNKLVWDVPDNLSYSKNIQNYLRTAGKSIKLSLSADLLLATEYAYTNQVKVSLKLNKNGDVQDAQIVSGSGSAQIDKIVLQSVKDTLNVVKPPVNEISTPNFNLNLIIYF